mgnify:FL=1
MENLSFIEVILLFIVSNILSFLFAFFLRKIKVETLSKKIVKLELELMESHSEVLREMQENVRLENSIKNLITSNYKEKQQLNN